MKKYLRFIIVFIAIPLISFCSRNNLNDVRIDTSSDVLEINKDSYMQERCIIDVAGDFGKYNLFAATADATIGISSSRYYPLGEERIIAFYEPTEKVQTKIVNDHASEIMINKKNVFEPVLKASAGTIEEMFGGNVQFDLSVFGNSTKSDIGDICELYAPEIIRIEFPYIDSEDDLNPLCYYKNFVVRWNKDDQNVNGVIIIVKWNGMMAFGEDYPSSYVQHILHVNDSGETMLEESMFNEIPDAAFCSLYVLRGDVENIGVSDETYRVLAESHDVLNFILIRNIEQDE